MSKKITVSTTPVKTINNEQLAFFAKTAKDLGIKKYDKLLTLMTSLNNPDLTVKVAEILDIKVAKTKDVKPLEVVISNYEDSKGNVHPTIAIGTRNDQGKFYAYLTLGKSKAKLVIEHLDAIKAFSESK